MSEMAMEKIRQTLAAVRRGEMSDEKAAETLARFISRESFAEFVVAAFSRGWITPFNLGIDDDGNVVGGLLGANAPFDKENEVATLGQFIKSISTENTGGGCMVDFIFLLDGRVIGVNDDCVVLYPTLEAFGQGDDDGSFDSFPVIDLPVVEAQALQQQGIGTFIQDIQVEYTVDVLTLKSGQVIGIDNETVCLYESLDKMTGGDMDAVIASINL